MADLTPERIAELRGRCGRISMPPAGGADDDDCVTEWHCSGCGKLSTRCECDAILAEAVPALLDEVERLRAENGLAQTLQQRLKLITDRLAEFESWEMERWLPINWNPREGHLVEWHNRLLSAVNYVRAIAAKGPDV